MARRSTGPLRVAACVAALLLQCAAQTAQAARTYPPDPCAPSASCPNATGAYVPPNAPGTPPRSPEPQQSSQRSILGDILIGLVAVAVIALAADALTGEDWATPAQLDENGPRFPSKQTIGKFQAQGYAMAGWPVVVDLDSIAGSTSWLEIKSRGHDPIRIPLPGDGRRAPVVQIPAYDWLGGPTVARFSVQSTYPEPNGEPSFQPVHVYGIAAGPRAVGSMKIFVTRFDPLETSRPADVQYGLRADRQFDRSVVEVLRLPKPGKTDLTLTRDARLLPLAAGSHDGGWATLTQRQPDRPGVYLLQTRAWLVGGRNDERDWTGAFAPNFVRVP